MGGLVRSWAVAPFSEQESPMCDCSFRKKSLRSRLRSTLKMQEMWKPKAWPTKSFHLCHVMWVVTKMVSGKVLVRQSYSSASCSHMILVHISCFQRSKQRQQPFKSLESWLKWFQDSKSLKVLVARWLRVTAGTFWCRSVVGATSNLPAKSWEKAVAPMDLRRPEKSWPRRWLSTWALMLRNWNLQRTQGCLGLGELEGRNTVVRSVGADIWCSWQTGRVTALLRFRTNSALLTYDILTVCVSIFRCIQVTFRLMI